MYTCTEQLPIGSAEFLDQLLTRATASGGSAAEVAQALDVPIALLERRAALEATRQQYPSESGPTDADICVEEQVGFPQHAKWCLGPTASCLGELGSCGKTFHARLSVCFCSCRLQSGDHALALVQAHDFKLMVSSSSSKQLPCRRRRRWRRTRRRWPACWSRRTVR